MDHSQIDHLQGLIYTYCGRMDCSIQYPLGNAGLRKCTQARFPGFTLYFLSVFTIYNLHYLLRKWSGFYIRVLSQEDVYIYLKDICSFYFLQLETKVVKTILGILGVRGNILTNCVLFLDFIFYLQVYSPIASVNNQQFCSLS